MVHLTATMSRCRGDACGPAAQRRGWRDVRDLRGSSRVYPEGC